MAVKEPEDASSGSASTSTPIEEKPIASGGLASRPNRPLEKTPPPNIILEGINGPGPGKAKLEGEIKSFYAARGFGFIACPKVWEALRCDVYFTMSEIFDVEPEKVEERVRKGVKCSFFFALNRDSRPQARVVRLQGGGPEEDRERDAKFNKSNAEDKQYTGKIKSFNASKGYGFISCDETFARFNRDVFLHHSQLKGLKAGDEVKFKIFVDKTKADAQAKALDLEAVNVSTGEAQPEPVTTQVPAAEQQQQQKQQKAFSQQAQVESSTPASPQTHSVSEVADLFVNELVKPAAEVKSAEAEKPCKQEDGWTRYVTEASDYWWHCSETDEHFMEKDPGPWAEFLDTMTNKKYWFHSEDGRCFWADD